MPSGRHGRTSVLLRSSRRPDPVYVGEVNRSTRRLHGRVMDTQVQLCQLA